MFRDCVVILVGLYLNEVVTGLDMGTAKYLYHSNLDGYLSNTNVLHSGMSRSKTECAISCEGRQPMCMSFFYVRNSGECKLHSTVFTLFTSGFTNILSAKFFERVNCPDGWIYFQESCYLFVYQAVTFAHALVICGQYSSNMVHIDGSDENNFLQNYAFQFRQADHWIGMADIAEENDWRWVDTSTALTYTDWHPGQPNDGRYSNCGVIWKLYGYTWVDEPCDFKYHPICERRSL